MCIIENNKNGIISEFENKSPTDYFSKNCYNICFTQKRVVMHDNHLLIPALNYITIFFDIWIVTAYLSSQQHETTSL